ncbi:DNA cytosine methyltransferase Zmet 3 [Panicum miliaceum]|uniref:DNA (cytosine-5-)-methyltransferase n=1 Tax=Panicum miliaceum TaxID=4540 RepID=A0A3L6STD8_PANMI|nr:DNA cytosine methyltransferase Zmet 3 [Panicum miliaceum]
MVDSISDSDEGYEFEWDSDGDREAVSLNAAGSSAQASRNLDVPGPSTLVRLDSDGKEDCGAGLSACMLDYFVGMGFSKDLVLKAMMEAGDRGEDSILDLLLKYKEGGCDPLVDGHSSGSLPHIVDDDDDILENWDVDDDAGNNLNKDPNSDDSDVEEFMQEMSQMDKKVESLVSFGFPESKATTAITRCGQDADIFVLLDAIRASEVAGAGYYESYANNEDTGLNCCSSSGGRKRTKFMEEKKRKGKRFGGGAQGDDRDDEVMPLPNPMVGFNMPGDRSRSVDRRIPKLAIGPPFFCYENVACAPKGVWTAISTFLYDIQPEFVDSKFFCAAARKRGYIHNLPVENRLPLIPLPPKTIHDAFPRTKHWWPPWDTRRQFNCIQTCVSSAKLTEQTRCDLANSEDPPCPIVQKDVLKQCRQWNLVWVGRNKVPPLEPDEVEFLLGFPKDHTRGISRRDRYRSLGNSFQVDTVAYHLSVLEHMFPNGMNVHSLFSGIGGAEVALHRLGIRMKTVVSVEKSEVNRTVLKTWWEQTQSGTLIEIADVQNLTSDWLESTMRRIGGFDLVIGGSPCNNLAGSNSPPPQWLRG